MEDHSDHNKIQTFVNSDSTDTMVMDWSHSLQGSRQHYTTSLNLESIWEKKIKEGDRETHIAAIWKQTSKKLDTVVETSSRPECLQESCWRPMHQK